MTPSLKSLAVPVVGCAITGWLCSPDAHAAIAEAVSNPPADVADLIQRWGVAITIGMAVVGTLAGKAITGWFALRRAIDEEQQKRREMLAEQQRHDAQIQDGAEQIKQVNAALINPIPAIPPPSKTQPLTP